MSLNTHTVISIAGQQFRHFKTLIIRQHMHQHHTFELHISNDWLQRKGKHPFTGSRELLGKDITICIEPAETAGHLQSLHFNGLVTAVHTGKESDGTHGCCILKGSSPAILLDNEPHMEVYENKTLQEIVHTCIKNLNTRYHRHINPVHTQVLPYAVQYRESHYAFLQRLAASYGESFFHDGQQLVFGAYKPVKTVITHPVELEEFDLRLQIRPINTTLHAYDYTRDMCLTADTVTDVSGNMHPFTAHALGTGNKLYRKNASNRQEIPPASHAQAYLATAALQHGKKRIASLVELSGQSKLPGIRIGDIIAAGESFLYKDQPGDFLLTQITHHCCGSGTYYNHFVSVPAQDSPTAAQTFIPPACEAQSAIVTDNYDPESLGRVKIRYRWQQQGSSPWIRVITPHGGANKGFYFLPETNEEVWVNFIGDHPEQPYVTGTAYNGKARTLFGDAGNNMKVISTRSGHTIRLDDSNGTEMISISDRHNNRIILDTHNGSITISAPEHLQLTARNISIQATENIEIHSGENINQGAGENISSYAGNNATLLSANIIQQAKEHFTRTSAKLEEVSGLVEISSTRDRMVLSSSKTVDIKSAEKVKLF